MKSDQTNHYFTGGDGDDGFRFVGLIASVANPKLRPIGPVGLGPCAPAQYVARWRRRVIFSAGCARIRTSNFNRILHFTCSLSLALSFALLYKHTHRYNLLLVLTHLVPTHRAPPQPPHVHGAFCIPRPTRNIQPGATVSYITNNTTTKGQVQNTPKLTPHPKDKPASADIAELLYRVASCVHVSAIVATLPSAAAAAQATATHERSDGTDAAWGRLGHNRPNGDDSKQRNKQIKNPRSPHQLTHWQTKSDEASGRTEPATRVQTRAPAFLD